MTKNRKNYKNNIEQPEPESDEERLEDSDFQMTEEDFNDCYEYGDLEKYYNSLKVSELMEELKKKKVNPKEKLKKAEIIKILLGDEEEKNDIKWEDVDFVPNTGGFRSKRKATINEEPIFFFRKFFDNQLLDLIVEQTKLYIEQKGLVSKEKKLFKENGFGRRELELYLGLIMLMGEIKVQSINEYFSEGLTFIERIHGTMTLNQFLFIHHNIHFANNNLFDKETSSKIFKIEPVLNHLEMKFKENWIKTQAVVVDEGIIPTKSKADGVLQYMNDKPSKWGFKVWKLCDAHHYLVTFDIYQQRKSKPLEDTQQTNNTQQTQPKKEKVSTKVVKDLIHKANLENGYHHLYMNRYFSSVDLFLDLLKMNVFSCGTIKSNRSIFPQSIYQGDLEVNESKWSKLKSNNLAIYRIHDTKEFYLASTIHQPTSTLDYKSDNEKRAERSQNTVNPPRKMLEALIDYRANIGHVDTNDQMIKEFSFLHHSSRWYLSIFFYFLETALLNSYILYKLHSNTEKSYGDYRKFIIESLLANETIRSNKYKNMKKALPDRTHLYKSVTHGTN